MTLRDAPQKFGRRPNPIFGCHKQPVINMKMAGAAGLERAFLITLTLEINAQTTVAEFKELKNPLVVQKTDLEQQIVALEGSKLKRLEPLRKWVLEANEAKNGVVSDGWLKMKSFLEKTGTDRFLRAQILTVSFKNPLIHWLKPWSPSATCRTTTHDVQGGGGGGN